MLFESLVRGGREARSCSPRPAPPTASRREVPIPESHPQWPINPYGWSKLFVERLLESFDRAYGLRFVALRYFNAAGRHRALRRGARPRDAPHPARAARRRRAARPKVSVFGDDYDTPDGTAVRDYIHVEDLGEAHLLALAHLRRGGASQFLNLGNGTGYSVLEVIETARRVTGRDVPYEMGPRREGDPPRLVGDATQARAVLGWAPRRPSLEAIVRSAWEWMQAHPDG